MSTRLIISCHFLVSQISYQVLLIYLEIVGQSPE